MVWIVSAGIDENVQERKARLQYIKEVSGDRYISWEKKQLVSLLGNIEYYQCTTKEGVNGTFITAHNYIVAILCGRMCVENSEFVVANTCKIEENFHKKILRLLQRINSSAQLYYAKQEKEVINGIERDSNIINNIGNFGFKTSKSERILYRKKDKGLIEAIRNSFDYIVEEEKVDEKNI